MDKLLKQLPVFFLTILWIYAAASKLIDFHEFRGQLYNQTFPHWLADILVYALPAAELFTVALLITKRFEKAGLLFSMALLIVFTGYIALVLLHVWPRVPCSCGGILNHLSWQSHFVFNVICLSISALALYQPVLYKKSLKVPAGR